MKVNQIRFIPTEQLESFIDALDPSTHMVKLNWDDMLNSRCAFRKIYNTMFKPIPWYRRLFFDYQSFVLTNVEGHITLITSGINDTSVLFSEYDTKLFYKQWRNVFHKISKMHSIKIEIVVQV